MKKKVINPKGAKRGTTLAELLIATFIFGFLTILLLAVMNFGTRAWRSLTARSSAQKEARRALLDISNTLRNTDIQSFNYGKADVSGVPVIWMAYLTGQAEELYDPEFVGYDLNEIPSPDNLIDWTYFVLYYAIPPPGDTCSSDIYNSSSIMSGQFKCPHKWLIKKFLLVSEKGGGDAAIKAFSGSSPPIYRLSTADVQNYLTKSESVNQIGGSETAIDTSTAEKRANSVRVLARDILIFAPNYYDQFNNRGDSSLGSTQVQFTLKCFKEMEYRGSGSEIAGSGIGTVDLNSSLIPPTYSVQFDQIITPSNSYYNQSFKYE